MISAHTIPDEAILTVTLRNGVRMPKVGLGTFKAAGNDVVTAVQAALASGIRHIDTAAIYKNEELVRQGITASGMPRDKLFVVSKLSPYQQGTSKAEQGCREMLEKLGTPVDLALIHWPGASGKAVDSPDNAVLRLETWRVLESMYEQGLFRSIGVSNFEVPHLQQLMAQAHVLPMVNQIECHPRRPCRQLREFCAANDIAVVAYSPLGAGDLVTHPLVCKIAERLDCSPAQVLLAWGLSQGCCVIPKSVKPERILEYAMLAYATPTTSSSPAVALSAEDLIELSTLEDGHKYCWDPSGIL